MRKLSRGALAALAIGIGVPATFAATKAVEHARWHNMSPETRARLDEGRLAMVKAALKLSSEQEKLWAPIETQVRDAFKARESKRAEFEKQRADREKDRAEGKKPNMAERFEKMSQGMSERADRMKAFSGAFKPFYAALSDEQKEVLRPLIRDLAPGFGGHGRGHRFAENFEGRGGHSFGGGWWGGHRGGHHGHRGDRGGSPAMEGEGGGGPGKTPPPAPNFAPEHDNGEGDAP